MKTANTYKTQDTKEAQRRRLFVDMDGTLAVFTVVDEIERLYEKGYFYDLAPQDNVVEGVRLFMKSRPDIEVNILSAYLSDSTYALAEKNKWLDFYLPEIRGENRIFVPCGDEKKEYVTGGIKPTDFLLDDYTKNLTQWKQGGGSGIKLLNGINHTRGTWQEGKIRFDKEPEAIAANLSAIIDSAEHIHGNNHSGEQNNSGHTMDTGEDLYLDRD